VEHGHTIFRDEGDARERIRRGKRREVRVEYAAELVILPSTAGG
jgi:hypothetical protein